MPAPHQNVQQIGASGLYGTYTAQGGTGMNVARDSLDAARIGQGKIPSAEYPDGYLGTIPSRRGDRMLDSIKSRENQRNYQRGVHRGERIDPGQYLWPMGLDPERGLRNQAMGIKTVPAMELAPAPRLVNDGKAGPTVVSDHYAEINPARSAQMSRLLPSWSK